MLLRRRIFEFRVEFVQNGGWIVNIFIFVSPLDRPRSALSLPMFYEYNILQMFTNACQCLYERCQRLRTLYQRLPMLTKIDGE